MDHELPGGYPEHVDALQAYARNRLGMEVQAITQLARFARGPEVWQVMTEVGTFWLVERDGVVELFVATPTSRARGGVPRYRFPEQAVRRFLELHP